MQPGGADAIAPGNIGAAALNSLGKVLPAQLSAPYKYFVAGKTLSIEDAGSFLNFNSSSAITVTVPANSTVAFPVSTEIEIAQWGPGNVTINPAAGILLVSLDNMRSIAGTYGIVVLKKIDTDTWILAGALA